jgi:YVTN family beta-propeller protein
MQTGATTVAQIEIFSTDTDDGTISVIGKTGKGNHALLRTIRVGNAPRGAVKFTASGRGFVSNTSQSTVSELDPVALEEVRRIEVGHGPRGLGIVPGDKYLLVSNSGSDTLSIIDLELNVEVRQIAIGRDPRHMALTRDGLTAFVCIWGDGTVAKLDLSGLAEGRPELVAITARYDVGRTAHPYSAAIEPSGQRVLVANTQAKHLSVIDIETGTVQEVELGHIGGRAVAFTSDGRYALVSIETVSEVAVIELASLRQTRRIPVGPGPRGLTVDADDDTLYITNFSRGEFRLGGPDYGPNCLTVVDLNSAPLDEPTGTFDYQPVEVGYGPCSVALLDVAGLRAQQHATAAGSTFG